MLNGSLEKKNSFRAQTFFVFALFFSGSECREFSWASKQMLFLHYFAKLVCNWQILKKRLFLEKMKYQILA